MSNLLIKTTRTAVRALMLGLMTPRIRGQKNLPVDQSKNQTGKLFFANHQSIADFALLWSSLPGNIRRKTRIVGAYDYWMQNPIRRFLARDVFNALLVHRPNANDTNTATRLQNGRCLRDMASCLKAGENLILFPEGTRGNQSRALQPFQGGLFALARLVKNLDMVPVWLGNLGQSMPKGQHIPLPLICQVDFGSAINFQRDEDMDAFNSRAQHALLNTAQTGGI